MAFSIAYGCGVDQIQPCNISIAIIVIDSAGLMQFLPYQEQQVSQSTDACGRFTVLADYINCKAEYVKRQLSCICIENAVFKKVNTSFVTTWVAAAYYIYT